MLQETISKDLRRFRFRANPDYELVLLDCFSENEQKLMAGLSRDPECYGVLRPKTSKLTIKAVSRDTALLFFTLEQPKPLPQYLENMLGHKFNDAIAQMVLDGILQIEVDGCMLCGPAAHAQIAAGGTIESARNAVAALSVRALQYAEKLQLDDAAVLANRLYLYNSTPASASWRSLLQDATAVRRYLGIGTGPGSAVLDRLWTRIDPESSKAPWIAWAGPQQEALNHPATTYKLYISPAPAELPRVFQATAEVIAHSHSIHVKVGSDVHGLLRPDKMVAYFTRLDDLHETAERLIGRLLPCAAQGVPFTSEIAGDGLLSWGADPPTDSTTVPWLKRQSWRFWITNRLAAALVYGRCSLDEDISGWKFALDRLRLDGINPETWAPSDSLTRAQSNWG